jgi:hypothetical protein
MAKLRMVIASRNWPETRLLVEGTWAANSRRNQVSFFYQGKRNRGTKEEKKNGQSEKAIRP